MPVAFTVVNTTDVTLYVDKYVCVCMCVNAFFLMSLFPTFSCEVIRDWKTGESLCYAFIEFEKVRHNTDM